MLPFSKEQVLKLRANYAIYMADSGRFNVVGMGDEQIDRFIEAVVECLTPDMADRTRAAYPPKSIGGRSRGSF